MRKMNLSDEQVEELVEKLKAVALHCDNTDEGSGNSNSVFYKTYALQTSTGNSLYQNLRDEVLLDVLRTQAEILDHSPAQKEVFWVWRSYIKKRFGKWPYALEAAGLKKAAGAGAKSLEQLRNETREYRELVAEVKKKAEEICRIPHPQEIPELSEQLKKHTDNWTDIIRDAGLNQSFFRKNAVHKVENLGPEIIHDLEKLRELALSLGRPPLKSEVPEEVKDRLTEKCGSFRNVLYQIDLEPVIRMTPFSSMKLQKQPIDPSDKSKIHRTEVQDCYYQVLNMDEQTRMDLLELCEWNEKLHHLPERKEIPSELRKRLQKSCGSWANALYQLDYIRKQQI